MREMNYLRMGSEEFEVVDKKGRTAGYNDSVANLAHYGIVSDHENDQYEKFFDVFHELAGKYSTFFLPKGYYIVSDSIIVPPNTKFVGEGEETVIYYNGEYSWAGTGIGNGGDNVEISNMRIEHYQERDIKTGGQGSYFGGIGFGTADFDSWDEYHTTNITKRHTKGLIASNIWSDSTYVLQTEPDYNHTVEDVQYRNIYAPNSLVSIHPQKNSGYVKNVILDDVICGMIRVGVGHGHGENIKLNNIRCYMLYVPDGATINNAYVDTSVDDTWSWYNSAFTFGNNITLTNSTIIGGGTIQQGCVSYSSTGEIVQFSNVRVKNFTIPWVNNATAELIFFTNCDFDGKNLPISNGGAVNCNASFTRNPNFHNLLNAPRFELYKNVPFSQVVSDLKDGQGRMFIGVNLTGVPSGLTGAHVVGIAGRWSGLSSTKSFVMVGDMYGNVKSLMV